MNFGRWGLLLVALVVVAFVAVAELQKQYPPKDTEITYLQIARDYVLPFIYATHRADSLESMVDSKWGMYRCYFSTDPKACRKAEMNTWSNMQWTEYAVLMSEAYSAMVLAREAGELLDSKLAKHGMPRYKYVLDWYDGNVAKHADPAKYIKERLAELSK